MSLPSITEIRGTGVYVPGDDIDTDRIIPARFMKCVTFDGLGEYAFYDERSSKPHFPLNKPEHKDASILLAGANFGCGSSREHAPQSLYHYGFRAVVAVSFAEIFFGNSTTLGIPCVAASREDIAKLSAAVAANPALELVIDVEKATVTAGEVTIQGSLPKGAQQVLLSGRWDPIAELLEGDEGITKTAAALPYMGV